MASKKLNQRKNVGRSVRIVINAGFEAKKVVITRVEIGTKKEVEGEQEVNMNA